MGLKETLRRIFSGSKGDAIDIGALDAFVEESQPQAKATSAKRKIKKPILENIRITDEFRKAIDLINEGCPIILVTGSAGTGKSTFIDHLREETSKRLAVVAPTGVAALNVRGQTLHSFFRFKPVLLDYKKIKKVHNRDIYKKLDLLVIDEISMVRADLLDCVAQFLKQNGPDYDKPLAGC